MSRALPLLLVAAAVTLGWSLPGYRLLDPDEGRNAEVAREMATSHDYMIPHLDGLPYLDKPVVYFAASAVAMTVLGPTETAARLPAYIATLATIALLAAFARRRWGPAAGWLAGLACATMPLTLAYAHTAIFDSTLTLCTTAAMLWLFEGRPSLAAAALAVGALTKGPIALALPLVGMAAYAGATGAPLRRLASVRALAVFVALSAPWVLAVTRRFPEFPTYVFALETLRRFTTPSFHRTAPLWYYVPIVAAGAFPWVVPACARLGRWRETWAARRDPAAREAIWLAAWVLAPLTLLSIDQSKLPQYALPIVPAFALAAARNLARDGPRALWRTYGALAVALGAVLVTLPMWLLNVLLPPLTQAERLAIPSAALVLGVVLVASAASLALAARRGDLRLGALAYGVVVMVLPFGGARLLRAVGDDRSAARLAAAIEPAVRGGATVLGIAAYPPSLPFYLQRTMAVATASARELTSTYITTYQARYRAVPGSPLEPAESWRTALMRCAVPTVFVAQTLDRGARAGLARLPLLADDGHYVAYGPCRTPGPGAE